MKQFFSVILLFVLISISAQTTLTRDLNYVDTGSILTFGDGSYLVSDTETDGFYTITKKLANGTIDTSYGTNGEVLIPASFASEQGQEGAGHMTSLKVIGGKFLVGHRIMPYYAAPSSEVYVKRYLLNGTLDTSFGNNGTLENLGFTVYAVHQLLNLEDLSFLEVRYDRLVKYTVDGQIDATYGNNGVIMFNPSPGESHVFAVRENYIYMVGDPANDFYWFDYTNPHETYIASNGIIGSTHEESKPVRSYDINENDEIFIIDDNSYWFEAEYYPATKYYLKVLDMNNGYLNFAFNGDGVHDYFYNDDTNAYYALNHYFVSIKENGDSYIMAYDNTGHPLTINNEFKFGEGEFPAGTDIYDIQKNDDTSIIISTSAGKFKYDVGIGGFNPCPTTTTWEDSFWSNGAPDATKNVIVKGILPPTATDIEACRLKVASLGVMSVSSGNSLTVERELISRGNLTLEDGSNLFQLDESISYGADIIVKKYSQPMKRLDYTLWSSPTSNTDIYNFSPNTLTNRIYTYEGTGYQNVPIQEYPIYPDRLWKIATGYLYRAPNDWSSTTQQPYLGEFKATPISIKGFPHNGNITKSILEGHTSIGNPYPSNISADLFLQANSSVSTLYFWTNPIAGSTGNNYATYTALGGVASGNSAIIPNGIISVAQGFLVDNNATTFSEVVFNNSMRVANSAPFFKGNQTDKHRFWLNLNNKENENLSQTLVGYMNGATNEIDNQIDGKMFGNEGSALYSIISEEKFSIQGRALPFEKSDVVKLGFKAVEAGKFTISLSNFDGLFAEGEVKIYLKDNELNTVHNLMESDYQFETIAGEFKTRFEIVYETEEVMGTGDLTANSVQIYTQNDNIIVNSKSENIISVELFDLNGRKIHSKNEINANNYQIKSNSIGVLVVKVQTQNGNTINQKIIVK